MIKGCVVCIDGWLCRVKTPSRSETRNVRSYFSGHYQAMWLNAQALCDERSNFIAVSVAASGGASDITAFRRLGLYSSLYSTTEPLLPPRKYILGDAAYVHRKA